MISPFTRLRLRLAAWYAGSFALMLILLGAALLAMMHRQVTREVRRTLEDSVAEVARATRITIADGAAPDTALIQAAGELDAPEHQMYVLDGDGRSLVPGAVIDEAIRRVSAAALRDGAAQGLFTTGEQRWRYVARPVTAGTREFAVVALTDAAALERPLSRLVTVMLLLGGVALVPVLLGGYALARLSARPVEASVERIRRFSTEAAHELRTPVAVIRARADLALSQPRTDGEYVAALREISVEAERVGALVADLLTLARWEAGDRKVESQVVFLDDVVEEAVRAAEPMAGAHGVALRLGSITEAAIDGDPALVRQVLMILLDNSIKFSRSGDVVTVGVAPEGDEAVVTVEDQGMGINPADLPHIFDRFFRSEWSRAHGGGAGLGLAIAKRIMLAHGGRLAVSSAPGTGTRVEMRFARNSRVGA